MQDGYEIEDLIQTIRTLERRIEQLEQSNTELRSIVRNLNPIINQVPVNRTNWVKQSPTLWSLTEKGQTYIVKSSSTFQSHDGHAPHNLFTLTEGDPARWATETNEHQNSWVMVKYPRKVKCNYLRIKNRANYIDECPYKFEIRGSNQELFTQGEYVVFSTIDKMTLNANEVKEFVFDNENEFEYYSIYIYSNNGSTSTALAELNFGYIR